MRRLAERAAPWPGLRYFLTETVRVDKSSHQRNNTLLYALKQSTILTITNRLAAISAHITGQSTETCFQSTYLVSLYRLGCVDRFRFRFRAFDSLAVSVTRHPPRLGQVSKM